MNMKYEIRSIRGIRNLDMCDGSFYNSICLTVPRLSMLLFSIDPKYLMFFR